MDAPRLRPSAPSRLAARLSDPLADPARDASRLRLSALLVVMGVLHFVLPGPFERIVPRWFPWRRQAVWWSGVAELASGTLLAVPATRRVGAVLATATIAAVFPANVQMAVDASRGRPQVRVPAWCCWARLPLQLPLLARAWGLRR